MLDNKKFNPDKLVLLEIKFVKSQIDSPEDFINNNIMEYNIENSLQLAFNLDDNLVKADYNIEISSVNESKNSSKAVSTFQIIFIYEVKNLNELTKLNKKNILDVDYNLANSIASITYSTSRGILITKLQGTTFNNFILPIINPNKLIDIKQKGNLN